MKLTAFSILLLSAAIPAFAGNLNAPEISPAAGFGALTLLSGGILVLRSRRAKR